MKSIAINLVKALTDNSGRVVFTTEEVKKLIKIAVLEVKGDKIGKINLPKLDKKIRDFKNEYTLLEAEWPTNTII
ncbi:hypothetical protein M0P65_06535 [Candidatus Gracilibacteria bacterium]|jgi:hypothetical protein|nr:hypothetical protein [Candidatus Gracilibacteria bacterium]